MGTMHEFECKHGRYGECDECNFIRDNLPKHFINQNKTSMSNTENNDSKMTIEQLFENQNPQDGTLPEWAKLLAESYAKLYFSEKLQELARHEVGDDGLEKITYKWAVHLKESAISEESVIANALEDLCTIMSAKLKVANDCIAELEKKTEDAKAMIKTLIKAKNYSEAWEIAVEEANEDFLNNDN